MPENDIISWQAPEYDYRPKDVSWKWIILIAAVILIVFAIWQKNPLFIFFIIIALFLINHFAGQFPKVWQFKISEKGISVSLPDKKEREKFYGFEDMESFDIHPHTITMDNGSNGLVVENNVSSFGVGVHPAGEEYKELILKLKSKFTPYLKINIHLGDEEKIRNFLKKFIPREEHNQSLVDVFSRWVGF